MKLFIWIDPYRVSYGNSMVFAVAETVEEAREQARTNAKAFVYGKFQEEKIPECVLGEPTRILDLPCAEWHKWEE